MSRKGNKPETPAGEAHGAYTTKLRILLAEDDQFARYGLRQMIQSRTPHQIVGEAANGEDAVRLTQTKKPDVVIMDAAMPGMDGVEATRRIVENHPLVRILVLSAHDEEKWIRAMFLAGARGFILKASGIEVLKEAVKAVAAGKYYVDEGMITNVVMRDYVRQLTRTGDSPPGTLTPREREVLQLIADGKMSKEIASRLSVTVKAVEKHRQQIARRLNLHSVAELTRYAIQEGFADPNPPGTV